MTFLTTGKYALRYPDLAQAADLSVIVGDLASDVDSKMVGYVIDIFSNRPAAGKAGRRFYATNTGAEYLDDGSAWHIIGSVNLIDTLGNRPAGNAVPAGSHFFATDQIVEYISDGTNWIRITTPAGATVDWFSASVPTGWVAYDGTALAGSTGIYADLYAHLGNTTTTPDTRGRILVGKGTHIDVSTIGNNDGLSVGSRRPKHKHTITDAGHVHTTPAGGTAWPEHNYGSGAFSSTGPGPGDVTATTHSNSTASATTGITAGPQTGSEPTDTSAYIVAMKIAKL